MTPPTVAAAQGGRRLGNPGLQVLTTVQQLLRSASNADKISHNPAITATDVAVDPGGHSLTGRVPVDPRGRARVTAAT